MHSSNLLNNSTLSTQPNTSPLILRKQSNSIVTSRIKALRKPSHSKRLCKPLEREKSERRTPEQHSKRSQLPPAHIVRARGGPARKSPNSARCSGAPGTPAAAIMLGASRKPGRHNSEAAFRALIAFPASPGANWRSTPFAGGINKMARRTCGRESRARGSRAYIRCPAR